MLLNVAKLISKLERAVLFRFTSVGYRVFVDENINSVPSQLKKATKCRFNVSVIAIETNFVRGDTRKKEKIALSSRLLHPFRDSVESYEENRDTIHAVIEHAELRNALFRLCDTVVYGPHSNSRTSEKLFSPAIGQNGDVKDSAPIQFRTNSSFWGRRARMHGEWTHQGSDISAADLAIVKLSNRSRRRTCWRPPFADAAICRA